MQTTPKNYSPYVLCTALSCLIYFPPARGFFVSNCNIKGSLDHPDNLLALCNKRHLTFVPRKVPAQTRILDLSDNKIITVNKNDLFYLTRLRHLNLSNNVVRDVEEGAFSSMVDLEELNLANNQLVTVSGRFFQNLMKLTVLRLDRNNITDISAVAFNSLTRLRVVNLSANFLRRIDRVQPVFQLLNVEELYLGRNGFTSFETGQISNTSLKLKALDLSHNPLQVFSISADVFPCLEFLDLGFVSRNMTWDVLDDKYLGNVSVLDLSGIHKTQQEMESLVQTFDASLRELYLQNIGEQKVKALVKTACLVDTLRTLNLKFNNITVISDEHLANCTNIEALDLSENRLVTAAHLPLTSMIRLQTLNVSHNKLNNATIGNQSTLRILDISYNSIHSLDPLDFKHLINLHTLYIFKNPLSNMEQDSFKTLTNLKTLMIGSGRLFSVSNTFKTPLHRLKLLDISQNKLTYIHKGDFKELRSLSELQLHDNQITTIDEGSFDGLDKLEILNLQSNKITQNLLSVSVFSGLTNLKYLFLNDNYISYLDQSKLDRPPFARFKKLDTLAVYNQRHKGMLNIPSNFLDGLESLQAFMAGNVNLKSLHPDTFKPTPNLWRLDISKNELTAFPPELFMPLKKLNRLYMSSTGLQSLDFLMRANLSEIRFLQVSKNALAVINETVISSLHKLIYIDLQENTFTCDCSNAWFVSWTVKNNDTQVINGDRLTCNYPSKLRGSKLMGLDLDSCIVDVGFYCFVSTTVLVSLVMVSSILFHFLKCQVVYAYYRLLAFLYDSKQRKGKLSSFQYDAFVSYNTHDELWVMSELLPQLEGQQGWRLCLHHRDFQPGKTIIDNIVDGIYGSRKTICVISRHYLESEWCSREIQVASFRLFDEKKDVLVLVFLEDIPTHQLSPYYRMRRIIKKRTYLTWPKPGQDARVFWQKLRVALETRGTSEEESRILSGLGRV